jgi:DNA-binding NarL/FixJ family response regulator
MPREQETLMSLTDCIKVLVAHDDPVAQAGLSAAFSRYADMEVRNAGDPGAGATAGHRAPAWSADVVVADYSHGVALAAQAACQPNSVASPKVVIVTGVDRECEIRSALERGVRGYLLVGCALDELAAGVRTVYRGGRHLSAQVAARLAESLSAESLTVREEEVLRLVADGLCNKAIGRQLGIAVGTVKSHLKSTFGKLNVESRTQAIVAVERRGLLRGMGRRAPADAGAEHAVITGWALNTSGSSSDRHAVPA